VYFCFFLFSAFTPAFISLKVGGHSSDHHPYPISGSEIFAVFDAVINNPPPRKFARVAPLCHKPLLFLSATRNGLCNKKGGKYNCKYLALDLGPFGQFSLHASDFVDLIAQSRALLMMRHD